MNVGRTRLHGKIIAVTGGASGIGAATACRLADEGASVVIGDVNKNGAAQTVAAIVNGGGTAASVTVDISNELQMKEFIDHTVDLYGGLDGLFNNAADISPANLGRDTDAVTVPLDCWRHTLDVNLTGYLLGIRHAVPELLRRGGGSIVNTVSDSVYLGEPVRVAYAVSKTAITALSRHTASRWGKEGIRSNCLAPGPVMTEGGRAAMPAADLKIMEARVRYSRLGEPEDLAAMAAFLLSDDSLWVNGQTLRVNGGQTLC